MLNDYFKQMIDAVFNNFGHGFTANGLIALLDAVRHHQLFESTGKISIKAEAKSTRTYTIKTVP